MRRTVSTLLMIIALVAGRAAADRIPSDRFADVALKLLAVDQNRERRVGGRHFEIVVLAPALADSRTPCDACSQAAAIVASLERLGGSQRTLDYNVIPFAAPSRCDNELMAPRKGTAAIIAVDLPADCVRNLAGLAKASQSLTISTRKDDVVPLSIAIVLERGQVQVYRSDLALENEGVRLSSDMKAVTRSVASVNYFENYREAIRAVDFRDWKEAERRLRAALMKNEKEGGPNVLIYGSRYQPYLPHYYLGVTYFNLGDCPSAMSQFAMSVQQREVNRWNESKTIGRYEQQCKDRLSGAAASAGPPKSP